ncbi:MAG: lytic murein transglycosylase [Desulfatitalea sp.]|nr:lytic murein transglycosylase [Desulfatitalea sp.]
MKPTTGGSTTRPLFKSLMGLCLLLLLTAGPAAGEPAIALFDALQQRLVADGYDADRIGTLYEDERVLFEVQGVAAYFRHNEATLNYDQFLQSNYIEEARAYLNAHAQWFEMAEQRFAVDPKVITAIILVETKFGRFVGNRAILNTLSTMASLTQSGPREYLWRQLPAERRFDRARFDQRADQRSEWAYRELKAFLTYTTDHGIDAPAVVGSYAGAMGIAQFMPTNILAYAVDGNEDGRIDLFDHPDAILSIASYLKRHGWKPGLDRRQAGRVVYHYNHSRYYVDTILNIVDLLKG